MNQKITTALPVAVIALTVVGYGAYRFGVSHSGNTAASDSIHLVPATGKRVLYWHDPMKPGQRFDKPGKSPYMDMQLVPVYADEAAASDGGVTVDPRVQQRLGVRLATVERTSLSVEVTAAGNVDYNERDVAVVQARANGFVERVRVRTPLQEVSAGQVLADVYAPEWVAAQEEYLAVEHMQSDARESLLDAAKQRMRLLGMSDEHIAVVAQTKTVQARLSLRAPIAGVITELNAREGMTVAGGAPLFRINGLNTVWVYAEVPEAQLARIKPGIAVTASATALPGVTLQGKVLAVLPEVSAVTRTAKARIELQNPDLKSIGRQLAPGMFVTVHFAAAPQVPALIVPSEALIVTGTRSVVILAEDGSRFRPVTVETGIESSGMTEVRTGLEEGQQVVVSAQFLIDSEASLKSALMRMSEKQPAENSVTPAKAGVQEKGLDSGLRRNDEQHEHGEHQ